jgi:hypothetical protein
MAMASKQKLKRKLRKAKTRHMLAISDLNIELWKLNHDLALERGKVLSLTGDIEYLNSLLDKQVKDDRPLDPIDSPFDPSVNHDAHI